MKQEIELILDNIRELNWFTQFTQNLEGETGCRSLGLPRSARLPVLAALQTRVDQPILLITDRADRARALADELAFWLPGIEVILYSEPNPLFYEDAGWGKATRIERIQVLNRLSTYHLPYLEKPDAAPVIVSSAKALMTRTIPRRDYLKANRLISAGQSYQISELQSQWYRLGYQAVQTVLSPGEFSHRGGILDVWPPTAIAPLRLDFWGKEIETIRRFDPSNQLTIETVEQVLISPVREFLLPEGIDQSGVEVKELTEFNIPLLHPYPASLLDYLPARSLVLFDDYGLFASLVEEYEQEAVRLRNESEAEGVLSPDYPLPYITWTEIADQLASLHCLELGDSSSLETDLNEDGFNYQQTQSIFKQEQRFAGRLKPFIEYLKQLAEVRSTTIIVSRQSSRLQELWQEETSHQVLTWQPRFLEASLSEGFSFQSSDEGTLRLITDAEIFGWVRPQARQKAHAHIEAPETPYADLNPGDWVVHVDYGIGKFKGLVERELDGVKREFISLEYKNGDEVFVPIHQADRINHYLGAGGNEPALGHLGTQEWMETRRRVKNAVKEIAADLLDLYAKRQQSSGFQFSVDSAWQKELENSFPYVETQDQVRVIADVKQDMESKRPMDRLLCGDVGYGKTEVALRAAFKASMDGKQVALLVPTTVLAQQHYETFKQRLAPFPVNVDMLSRFRTHSEQAGTLQQLAQGAIDIVIGTHRLIQADVQFKDLGLVIIDEEQRFGVTHKEHLKKLRNEVDILTLTATPIPRTLYMALTGVRDISQLNTPPEERLPVVTHIGPYSPRLVRHAILRELERGGQVFFVHNRVQTIDAMKMHLNKLVPEARIAIGHGQMPENELSEVMHDFTAARVDVLLCTSIIESGLDIPNANTLIVDRGDAFGLAQLYQLRGRVGRGAVRAYAYFFRHRKKSPTIEGQERLEIISENTQLGSGYSIAMRDLEMRGAGELLGTRQHGYIASVGFHLYTRLLAAAVRSQRKDRGIPTTEGELPFTRDIGLPVNVDLPLPTGIPSDYIPDQKLRMQLYRRLADLRDEQALEVLAREFTDRFGAPPQMVVNLFFQLRVKLLAEQAGLLSISLDSGQLVLRYPAHDKEQAEAGQEKPVRKMKDLGPGVRSGKNAYWLAVNREGDWQKTLLDTLRRLLILEGKGDHDGI